MCQQQQTLFVCFLRLCLRFLLSFQSSCTTRVLCVFSMISTGSFNHTDSCVVSLIYVRVIASPSSHPPNTQAPSWAEPCTQNMCACTSRHTKLTNGDCKLVFLRLLACARAGYRAHRSPGWLPLGMMGWKALEEVGGVERGER